MKCPNCGTGIHLETDTYDFFDQESTYGSPGVTIEVGFCPECKKPIVVMKSGKVLGFGPQGDVILSIETEQRLYPPQEKPTILDPLIPPKYASLFHESELVNNISPRSSATLSRYLLQMLLHEELHIEKRNLEQELDELEKRSEVPSNLITMLQIMRRVANFGAHPKKSTNTGEVVEVEKGESDIMLELILELFDYLFIKPKQQEQFLKKIEEKYGIKP